MSTVQITDALPALRAFSELTRGDVDYSGGKGANLGELTQAGVPVPPGFVVGAPAYAAFCDDRDLRARVAERLDGLDVEDTAALEIASADVRAMIVAEPVSERLAESIRTAYAELAGADELAPVAVRSSATAEDTESASFAGMNQTYLNVRGADDVVAAVRRCWASLFGSRTVFYRAKRGFAQSAMDIAVVVQRQVQSTRAGVMFTIDPSSGREDHIVIEAVSGWRERRLRPGVARPLRRRQGVDDDGHARGPPQGACDGGRGRWRNGDPRVVPRGGLAPVLNDDEVRRLADMAVRIERHYGSAQDTE